MFCRAGQESQKTSHTSRARTREGRKSAGGTLVSAGVRLRCIDAVSTETNPAPPPRSRGLPTVSRFVACTFSLRLRGHVTQCQSADDCVRSRHPRVGYTMPMHRRYCTGDADEQVDVAELVAGAHALGLHADEPHGAAHRVRFSWAESPRFIARTEGD